MDYLSSLSESRELQQEVQNCTEAEECTLISPDGNEVFKNCFESVEGSDLTNFCGCADFYGWRGEFCDKTSIMLILARVFASLRMIVTVYTLVRSFVRLRQVLVINTGPSSHLKKAKLKTVKQSKSRLLKILMFIVASSIASLMYGSFSFIAAYDSTAFELYTYKYFADDDIVSVNQKFGVIVDICSVLIIVFAVSASLQISLSWVELIEKYDSIFKSLKHSGKLNAYKNGVKYVTIFLILFCLGFIATGYLIPSFAGGIIASVLLLILFLVGRHVIEKQIEKSQLSSKSAILLFNKSTRSHVIILGIVVVSMAAFAGLDSIFVESGQIRPAAVAINLLLLSILFLLQSDLWYVGEIIKNLQNTTSGASGARKESRGFSSIRSKE